MANDLWTKAGQALTTLAEFGAGPPMAESWQALFWGATFDLALGFAAGLSRLPLWACWCGFVVMVAKELAIDLPRGGLGLAALAESNLDLALPILGCLLARSLLTRIKA